MQLDAISIFLRLRLLHMKCATESGVPARSVRYRDDFQRMVGSVGQLVRPFCMNAGVTMVVPFLYYIFPSFSTIFFPLDFG